MTALGLDLKVLYNLDMKFNGKKALVVVLILFVFLLPIMSFAQGDGNLGDSFGGDGNLSNPAVTTIKNPINAKTINDLIEKILEGVIKIGIPIIALAIIYSGFLFVSAQGNTEKLATAKKSFTYTLIGAAILLGAWALAQVISETVLAL